MAAVLQKCKAYGVAHRGSTRSHAHQVLELHISAANTDTAYDFGTTAGTFWTGAVADATYGALATAARTVLLTGIAGALSKLIGVRSETLIPRIQVASGASGTQFVAAISSSMPTITFVSGSAPTTWMVTLEWALKDGFEAISADYGDAV